MLGAGKAKIANILDCSLAAASIAMENFIRNYPGLKKLKTSTIPSLAAQGYFLGFDGRPVVCNSQHLLLAGMLQNGERVVMSRAACRSVSEIEKLGLSSRAQLINMVHDEMIFLVDDDKELCEQVKKIAEDSITCQGEELKLNCPMKGDGQIGKSWLSIH